MVIRRGIRTVVNTLALYLVAGGCVGYFVYHAQHGARGLDSKLAIRAAIFHQRQELAALGEERKGWQERVDLLRRDATDKDILDERVRDVLGRVHRNDVVVMGR